MFYHVLPISHAVATSNNVGNRIELNHVRKIVEQRKLKKGCAWPELRILLSDSWNDLEFLLGKSDFCCEAVRKQNSEPKGHSSG